MRARSTLFTLFTELIYPKDHAWVGSLVHWMKLLGFSEPAVRAAVSRSTARGWLQREGSGRRAYYKLSPRVAWQVKQVRRRLYPKKQHPWNGHWRILVYTIPEDRRRSRDRFRSELALMGFGSPASGVWMSPTADLEASKQLVAFYALQPYVEIFLAKHHSDIGERGLVERSFNLKSIETHQRDLLRRLQVPVIPTSPEASFRSYLGLVHETRKLLFFDPGLPPPLAPMGYLGPEVRAAFLQQHKELRIASIHLCTAISQTEH